LPLLCRRAGANRCYRHRQHSPPTRASTRSLLFPLVACRAKHPAGHRLPVLHSLPKTRHQTPLPSPTHLCFAVSPLLPPTCTGLFYLVAFAMCAGHTPDARACPVRKGRRRGQDGLRAADAFWTVLQLRTVVWWRRRRNLTPSLGSMPSSCALNADVVAGVPLTHYTHTRTCLFLTSFCALWTLPSSIISEERAVRVEHVAGSHPTPLGKRRYTPLAFPVYRAHAAPLDAFC